MARQLYNAAGRPIALPETPEDAKRYRYPHYAGSEECPICVERGFIGMVARKRYARTRGCVHCASMAALEFQSLLTYSAALNRDGDRLFYVILSDGSGREVNEDYFEYMERSLDLVPGGPAPTTREGALKLGAPYYVRDVPCRTKGHLGITTLKGECYFCEEERTAISPRQEAIRDGKKWYLPAGPCQHCGQIAEKRVDNGQCKGCIKTPGSDARETPDSVMMRESPDLVVSRKDAEAVGFKVYRTGEECSRGHTGYRYVSTGNCIECLRNKGA